jgi:hypothetical protein
MVTTIRLLFVLICACLVSAPAASAHGLSKGTRMVAEVTSALPAGVDVLVVSGDDELRLRNSSGKTVVVLGYGGEPYLRFDPRGGISTNLRSPALTLNAVRFPPEREWRELTAATPPAKPEWQQVDDGDTYTWVDHRIHLISKAKPPAVRADPGKPHLIRRWTVPLEVGGERVAVRGTLRYEPGGFDWLGSIPAIVALVVIAAAAISVAAARRGGVDPDDEES